MGESIKVLFAEREWEVLEEYEPQLCNEVKDLPVNMEVAAERMEDDHE